METKFTKGEWLFDENTVYSLHEVPFGNSKIIGNRFYASIYGDVSNIESSKLKGELIANAKLMAAAPDLFNALLSARFYIQQVNGIDVENKSLFIEIDKAIKKVAE